MGEKVAMRKEEMEQIVVSLEVKHSVDKVVAVGVVVTVAIAETQHFLEVAQVAEVS